MGISSSQYRQIYWFRTVEHDSESRTTVPLSVTRYRRILYDLFITRGSGASTPNCPYGDVFIYVSRFSYTE